MPVLQPILVRISLPTPLGSRASGACRFAALAAWLRHERNHGCGATFSFAVNRFCLDGGGAYAPDEIGGKIYLHPWRCGRGISPLTIRNSFPQGRESKATPRNTGWQSRVISDECMICRRLALFHRSHIVRSFASRAALSSQVSFLPAPFSPLPSCLGHAVSAANRQAPQARRG